MPTIVKTIAVRDATTVRKIEREQRREGEPTATATLRGLVRDGLRWRARNAKRHPASSESTGRNG